MSFLRRVLGPKQTPEEAEAKRVAKEAARARAAQEADDRRASAARAAEEARVRAAQQKEEADRARWTAFLGPDLAALDSPTTPAEAKLAIKAARLRKKEIQAQKQELASQLADVREGWRERQAGRYPTRGMGRGMTGQIVRGSIQAKRRSERQDHAQTVNRFSDRRQQLDEGLRVLDRLIIEFERVALRGKAE